MCEKLWSGTTQTYCSCGRVPTTQTKELKQKLNNGGPPTNTPTTKHIPPPPKTQQKGVVFVVVWWGGSGRLRMRSGRTSNKKKKKKPEKKNKTNVTLRLASKPLRADAAEGCADYGRREDPGAAQRGQRAAEPINESVKDAVRELHANIYLFLMWWFWCSPTPTPPTHNTNPKTKLCSPPNLFRCCVGEIRVQARRSPLLIRDRSAVAVPLGRAQGYSASSAQPRRLRPKGLTRQYRRGDSARFAQPHA